MARDQVAKSCHRVERAPPYPFGDGAALLVGKFDERRIQLELDHRRAGERASPTGLGPVDDHDVMAVLGQFERDERAADARADHSNVTRLVIKAGAMSRARMRGVSAQKGRPPRRSFLGVCTGPATECRKLGVSHRSATHWRAIGSIGTSIGRPTAANRGKGLNLTECRSRRGCGIAEKSEHSERPAVPRVSPRTRVHVVSNRLHWCDGVHRSGCTAS